MIVHFFDDNACPSMNFPIYFIVSWILEIYIKISLFISSFYFSNYSKEIISGFLAAQIVSSINLNHIQKKNIIFSFQILILHKTFKDLKYQQFTLNNAYFIIPIIKVSITREKLILLQNLMQTHILLLIHFRLNVQIYINKKITKHFPTTH